MRFHKAKEDMKAKQHAIEDSAKKTAEMQTRFQTGICRFMLLLTLYFDDIS